jgi:alanyl-tRNA synthetase
MQSEEIRKRFLEFFKARGHAVIPSASLVPENDPSVLFTTAGMQSLVPYLLGEVHPEGKRLVNIQKCVRTQDIEEVGDATHDTFFEMLGNWSLGDYFKEDAIKWSYEFFISKEEGLGLDPNRLYITCFAGDKNAPKDEESAKIWESLGIPKKRIYFLEDNWWSPGKNGPCGPDTEIFYDVTSRGLGDMTHDEFLKADSEQKVVETGNNVFIEYEKSEGEVVGKLKQKNVDFGGGLERQVMASQGVDNIFDTDLFTPLMREIEKKSYEFDLHSSRIVADHVRTAIFMISNGVEPSNTDRGYILRRLVRRAVRHADKLSFSDTKLSDLVDVIVEKYKDIYDEVDRERERVVVVLDEEEEKFEKTLKKGLREFEKISGDKVSSQEAFDLYQSYGFPVELTKELAKERGKEVDTDGFHKLFEEHQDKSRKGAEKKFKGGLGDTSEMSVRYHTATHLLNAALRRVLGEHVEQKGSNITPERLRFDFSHPEKMTDEQKREVEDLVNEKIEEALEVSWEEMSLEDARKAGALGVFGEKYADIVKVYSVGDFSKEICGGPHVENTKELGKFKIKKEESVSAGVRRIKAILE